MKPNCWDCKYFERVRMSAFCHGGKRITKLRQKDWYSGGIQFCTYFKPKDRVIREEAEDVKKEIPETTRILAEVLTGSPLSHPCDKLWSREGWCKDHCKKGQTEPDMECWLKYAETIAVERKSDESN